MEKTKQLIQRARTLAGAATPGPWRNGISVGVAGVNDGSDPAWKPTYIPAGRCSMCREAPEPCSVVLPGSSLPTQYDRKPGNCHIKVHVTEPSSPVDAEEPPDNRWRYVYSLQTYECIVGGYDWEEGAVASTPADAVFIAEARELVPALCDEIEHLQTRLEEVCRGAVLKRRAHERLSAYTQVYYEGILDEKGLLTHAISLLPILGYGAVSRELPAELRDRYRDAALALDRQYPDWWPHWQPKLTDEEHRLIEEDLEELKSQGNLLA